jgi:hypothetical protein
MFALVGLGAILARPISVLSRILADHTRLRTADDPTPKIYPHRMQPSEFLYFCYENRKSLKTSPAHCLNIQITQGGPSQELVPGVLLSVCRHGRRTGQCGASFRGDRTLCRRVQPLANFR